MRRASIQLLAVGPCREGKVSRCSNDLSLLKSSSICQRSRYKANTPIVGSSSEFSVVSIHITSPVRVREATARAGTQAMAFAKFQVLWLLVGFGGTGINILNSTPPPFSARLALFPLEKCAAAPHRKCADSLD